MDEKLKIKISIAERVYPLTVELSQEEGLRSATKKIDAMIKQFEENYAVRDKQDVLAMCALQFASQAEQKQIDNAINGDETIERLNPAAPNRCPVEPLVELTGVPAPNSANTAQSSLVSLAGVAVPCRLM